MIDKVPLDVCPLTQTQKKTTREERTDHILSLSLSSFIVKSLVEGYLQ